MQPVIECYFGRYKLENGNYLIKPTNVAIVRFKDAASVDKGLINFYKEENYENNPTIVGMILYKTKKGQYILGIQQRIKSHLKKQKLLSHVQQIRHKKATQQPRGIPQAVQDG